MPYIIRNGIQYAAGLDVTTYNKIGSGNLSPSFTATNLIDACNELKSNLDKLNFAKRAVNDVKLSSSSSATVTFINAFFSFMIMGFVQGLGSTVIVGKAEKGTVTAINALTGSAWSSSHLVLTANNNKLTLSSDNANESSLTVIGGNI